MTTPRREGIRPAGWEARLLACALLLALGSAQPAGAGLAERLARGETITIVALGDSLAAGFELADPVRDAYPSVLASVLQRRYPKARIRPFAAGIPGDTAWGGAGRLDRDVLPYDPDVVLVQFGGNDHFFQRPADEYRSDLESIVGWCRRRGASAILAAPPIVAPATDTPMVKAAKEAGLALRVPVADLDGALRKRGAGSRGPFPLGRHPGPYQHTVIARSFYEAFLDLAGGADGLRVSAEEGARVLPRADAVEVPVRVKGDRRLRVTVTLECEGERLQQAVTTDGDGEATARFRVPLGPWDGRSRQRRFLVCARAGAAFDYDRRFLTVGPVARTGGDACEIGVPGLVFGARSRGGAQDLGGQFRVTREGDRIHVEATVADGQVVRNAHQRDPFESDCVEVYLDLRPAERQACPYWEEGVVCLFLRPGTAGSPAASWSPLDPLPETWQALEVRSTAMDAGYRVELGIPLSLLPGQGKAGVPIGFDVALDDADDARGRRAQMTWAGGADDFLDPSLYGALELAPAVDDGPRMRVSVW